jgi:hypothetical protein
MEVDSGTEDQEGGRDDGGWGAGSEAYKRQEVQYPASGTDGTGRDRQGAEFD